MRRILIAMLLVAGCTPSPPAVTPTPSTTMPGLAAPEESPSTTTEAHPPGPNDWLYIEIVDANIAAFREYRNYVPYRSAPPVTLRVTFHNAGEEPVGAPTMELQFDPQVDNEMPHEIIESSGDGWTCSTTATKVTCSTGATANPGESLPPVDLEVRPDLPEKIPSEGYVAAHFTATLGDISNEAWTIWDTST